MATTAEAAAGDTFVPSSMWWVVLLQGIAAIVIGILLFTDPAPTLVTLTLFLGVYWFIGGIFSLVRMFTDGSDWGWHLIAGLTGLPAVTTMEPSRHSPVASWTRHHRIPPNRRTAVWPMRPRCARGSSCAKSSPS